MILRERLVAAGGLDRLSLADDRTTLTLDAIVAGGRMTPAARALAGRRVILAVERQLTAARAMIALDGLVARLVLVPPGLEPDHVARLAADSEAEICVCDGSPAHALSGLPRIAVEEACSAAAETPRETEWALATSGTTGAPKLVAHSLEGLAGGINAAAIPEPGTVWSTFYDIRRYGGLQVFLRAILGPSSLVLSDRHEPIRDFLIRAGAAGVTHVLGTPSHWRLALMSGALDRFAPRYVRLSGEIADQGVLDRLVKSFPKARVAHAYASTEGGVGFSVEDGREGFPAALVGARSGIEIAVRDDVLHVRSGRTGRRYLGSGAEPLVAEDGFVDTGDAVERRGDRYHFLGRRSGVINVGGTKVQPEEVEAVIHRHPRVSMARARGRPSPILGALVVADIVVHGGPVVETERAALGAEILALCRRDLPAHKVPARLAFVEALPVNAGGKLVRGRS